MAMNKKFVKMHRDKRAEMGVGTMIIFIAMVLVAAVAASVLISTANTVREQATQTGNDAIAGVSSGFDIKYVKGTVAGNEITQMDVFVQLHAGSPALKLDDVILSVTAGGKSGEIIYAGAGTETVTPMIPATDTYDSPIYTYDTDQECVKIGEKYYAVDTDPQTVDEATPLDPASPEPKMIPGEPITQIRGAAAGVDGRPAKYSATLVPPAKTDSVFDKYGTVAQGDLVKITIEYINGDDLNIKPGDNVNIKIMPARGVTTTVSFTVDSVLYDGSVNLR